MRLAVITLLASAGLFYLIRPGTTLGAPPAPDVIAVTSANTLIRFNSDSPGTIIGAPIPITGLAGGETILAIDFRPATGELFGLGSGSRLYVINPLTGVATQRGADGAFTLAGTSFGFDFNPVADRIRVTSHLEQNIQLNPNDGTLAASDTPLAYVAGDPNFGQNPAVGGVAYTNNILGATQTTLFGIDTATNRTVHIGSINGSPFSPNSGRLTTLAGVFPVDPVDDFNGFDIKSYSDGSQVMLAALSNDGTTSVLYDVTPGGTLISKGTIGGVTPILVRDIAIQPAASLSANAFGVSTGNNLVRFNTFTPGTIVSTTPITGLEGGETVLGIDFRPANERLYALGSTGRIYIIDQGTAVATQVATLTADPTDATSPFTSLSGTEFGIDFNPTADRLRVVSNMGQNLRIQVDSGRTVTDANLNPGTPSVTGAAYTNNEPGATTTTLYDIDTTADTLVIQNPPNNGTLVAVGPLGVDASAVLGFDIRDESNVAYATMVVGGVPGFYSINLATGAATLIGSIGGGTTLRGLAIAPTGFTAGPTIGGPPGVTFFGDDASNSLVIDSSGGLLRHNRFSLGDAGFNSDFDFDTNTPGDQTLTASDGIQNLTINGGLGDDAVQVGSAASPASDIATHFLFNGEGGNDSLDVNDSASTVARDIDFNTAIIIIDLFPTTGGTIDGFSNNGPPEDFRYANTEVVTINAGGGNDQFGTFRPTPATTFINGNGGNDTLHIGGSGGSIGSLSGGVFDGGAGSNTISYQFYNPSVTVDLRETQTYFTARLSGRQEPGPLSNSPGRGQGVFLLNQAQNLLTFNIPFSGLTSPDVTGAHFHNAPIGVNGPIVRGLSTSELGTILAAPSSPTTFFGTASGFWTSFDSQPLTPALVTELLNNRIYFNIHTIPDYPSGEIRGQLINMGQVGTATGTGGIRSVQNVVGGNGSDSITVAPSATSPISVDGGPGTDTLTVDFTGVTNPAINAINTSSGQVGSYTFGNRQPVNFVRVENLSPAGVLTISDVTVTEGNSGSTNAVFTVTLAPGATSTVTVDYFTANGSATEPSDYTAVNGTLTFAPGQTTKTIVVPVNGDTAIEPNETFSVNLINPTGAILTDSQAIGTITNDDGPIVQLSASSYQISENATNTPLGFAALSVDVTRGGDTSVASTIRYSTSDLSGGNECNQVTGNASQRCDYLLVAGTLRFAAGETTKTITIPIVKDGYVEGPEVFTLQLQNPVGSITGQNSQATITILDSGVATTPAQNPYLSNSFFVRMNYLDYLGRDADQAGFTTWVNTLNNCGPEKGFLGAPKSCDRAHVSHGFFASPEFTDRGFLIYRLYEVGLGRLPRYSEFMPDMATLSGFDIPETVREQNLQDYLQQFASKPEFTALFSDSLQPSQAAQLIAKLEAAAGVTLPATATNLPGRPPQYGRQELINLRGGGTLSVGQTLKAFVEQQVVYDKFFPRAAVTMEYFAHLRRDPDLNDPGLVGWTDWVDVFTNGRPSAGIAPRDIHHLIFGFIYSEEYRKRFGQP